MTSDDEMEQWAEELEHEIAGHSSKADKASNDDELCFDGRNGVKKRKTALEPPTFSNLPGDILVRIMRLLMHQPCSKVCKSWEQAFYRASRDRCVDLLSSVLPIRVASRLERAIFELCGKGAMNKDYHSKVRQLIFNLKEERNPTLRARVLLGDVAVKDLVLMDAETLACPELKERRKEWAAKKQQEVTYNATASADFTVSDMFTCQNCGGQKTMYRQWRRKAAVDRFRIIIICLTCRANWEL